MFCSYCSEVLPDKLKKYTHSVERFIPQLLLSHLSLPSKPHHGNTLSTASLKKLFRPGYIKSGWRGGIVSFQFRSKHRTKIIESQQRKTTLSLPDLRKYDHGIITQTPAI